MIEPDLFAALETAARRFEAIVAFGDPFDISEEPESFGGTDDGLETVCMAYENMQGIAERGLAEVRAALRDRDAMQARKAGGFEPRRGRSPVAESQSPTPSLSSISTDTGGTEQ